MKTPDLTAAPRTTGRVLHAPLLYDLMAWALMRGREQAFRERLLDLARPAPGERVLDVGCGTGTLAIAARERVGERGFVAGIDPSPQMIARAVRKAARAGANIDLRPGTIEALPFPGASLDLVLSTLMFHHLPRPLKEAGLREARRVLKPGGRLFIADFGPARKPAGLLGRLHRYGRVKFEDVAGLMAEAGLSISEQGDVGLRDLQFLLATR